MRHTIFEGKKLFVRERDGWEYVERKSATEAVAVLAKTDAGEIVLTEQYRRAVDARVIDFVAGLLDEHGAAETARQELREEAGFECVEVEPVTSGPSSPGITSEIVHFYRASGLRRVRQGGGIDNENITVHLVRENEILDWLHRRKDVLIDLKIWGGLFFLLR